MKISNEIKVGILGAVTLLMLIFGYNYLKGSDLFSSTQKFYAVYSKVDGLNVANAVQINGLTVGKVENLTLMEGSDSNKIIVGFSIKKKIKLHKNAIFKIASADLLGSKIVRLELGNGSLFAADGDTLTGASEVSLIDDFTRQIEPLKKKAEKLIVSIDSVLGQVKIMFNKEGKGGLTTTVNDLEVTIRNIRETTEHVNIMVKNETDRLDGILKNVASITDNLKKNNDAITHALNNIDKITDDLAKSNLKQTVENANKAIADITTIMDKIKSGQGTLGLLVNDDKLYNNLQTSSADLDKLIVDLKANPKRYVSISVFGGKEKSEKPKEEKK